ncbi:uncharacterized protein KD926_003232 [Aspergillus affinis]|uniref:uncharacterized protein n=1 Tax=Aspergillus affinis TaxID=1070780 RepID=UPI0022FEF349|nr:uncharacterized protein KD926_003232 [Aspergillus affinis]KAI9035572.1 hypothetical protein KD926_003232 [Aspergillus affinis]
MTPSPSNFPPSLPPVPTMDPFTQLPPELLARILVYTADFSAVESIITASPQCGLSGSAYHSARTQRLACVCLTLIQQNFVSALNGIDAGDIPASHRVNTARESFSFTEVYRVYSSMWHLRHHSSLREAARCWNWDETSMRGLDAYNEWNDTDVRRAEKMWTTAALLSDLAQDPEGKESSRAAWTFPDETPLPLLQSFDLPPGRDMTRPPLIWSPPSPPPDTEATEAWSLRAASRPWLPQHDGAFEHSSVVASHQREPFSYSFVNFKQW